ncbi:hypothetical protein NXS19_007223 [Fusarium pseudograminearum]|nr:hypothetical protein NXS19_007223 [Fusarium pseudograminearum]
MRFTAFLLPIVLGAVSAGPCRPSSAESSAETTELGSVTTTDLFQTITATLSTDDAATAVPTTEIESASTTTHIIESTTESAAATSSTTAALANALHQPPCNAARVLEKRTMARLA